MGKRITDEEWVKRIEKHNEFKVLKVFKKGYKRYVRVECNTCGGVSEKEASNADGRQGCRYCKHGHSYIKEKSNEQFCKELYEKWGNRIWTNDEYVGANTRMIFHCGVNSRHKIWQTTPDLVLHGRGHGTGCPECSYIIRGENKRRSSNSYIKEYVPLINKKGGKLLQVYREGAVPMLMVKCKEGHVWNVIPNSLKSGSWCPQCAGSNMERNMGKLLDINDIDYVFQYYKQINGHNHLFDFKLQDVNGNNVIIELDGKQHTDQQSNWYRGTERDNEKDQWCHENHIKIIRLPYDTTLNNMRDVLEDTLGYYALKIPNIDDIPLFKQYKEILEFYLVPEHTLKETADKYHVSTEFVKRNTKKTLGMTKGQYLAQKGIYIANKPRPIVAMDAKGNKFEFESCHEAESVLGIDNRQISPVLTGKRKTCHGYRFEYKYPDSTVTK